MADVAWVVYVICDPRTDVVRYVGTTQKNPNRRFQHHVNTAKSGRSHTHCGNWLRSLLSIGVNPLFRIVETGVGAGWSEAEKRWIAKFKKEGVPLTNHTDGGEGHTGYQHSAATRAKRSASMKETLRDPAVKARMSLGLHIANAHPETKARHSLAQKQVWTDPQIRERIIATQKQVKNTPEAKAHMSAKTKASWTDPVNT